MAQESLTPEQVAELSPKVLELAKKVLVIDELKYIETKVYEVCGHSVYHIFGGHNKAFDCWQKITYSPTSNSIEFTTWAIQANI
jgi:hypothetical protein